MSYNRLIAIGDSFTRGDELADCPVNSPRKNDYSNSTWPALLAQKLNLKYHSRSKGGIGNQWISWKASAGCKSDTLYVINWTFFERFDYLDVKTNWWTTTHPRHEDNLNHYFYKNIDSDIWNMLRNLQFMHSTLQLLLTHKVAFIMTCIDNQFKKSFDTIRSNDEFDGTLYNTWNMSITRLQEQIIPYITEFDNMSFIEWANHNNFEFGNNGHPLEKAHTEAARYINTLVTEGNLNGYRKT